MNIRDAINAIRDGNKWARPSHWRGSGEAITAYCEHRLAVVPSATGGKAWHPSVKDVTDDWDVLEPDEVLDERHPDVW